MALPSWERKREGERMDLTCQWSLQRVVDLEDLDFDFCLRCLLCLHSPHQCWLCYLDQWVLKKRNGNLSLTLPLSLSPPISFSFLISQSVFWTHLSSAFAVISLTYNTTSFPSLLFFLTFCFTSSLSVQQTRNPTNKMPFYSKQQQLTPPPQKKEKTKKTTKQNPLSLSLAPPALTILPLPWVADYTCLAAISMQCSFILFLWLASLMEQRKRGENSGG